MALPQRRDRLPVFDLDSIAPTPELLRRLEASDDPEGRLHELLAEQLRTGKPIAGTGISTFLKVPLRHGVPISPLEVELRRIDPGVACACQRR